MAGSALYFAQAYMLGKIQQLKCVGGQGLMHRERGYIALLLQNEMETTPS